MKKHAIIPIFIPHEGCPNDCVFCNQKKITARQKPVHPEDVKNIIEQYLTTLTGRGLETIEVAFFGGSFTGIPLLEQSAYLAVAKQFKDNGFIDKIHLSTRPDYINEEILDNLKYYDTDIIELGVQSFDDSVLKASNRGHNSEIVYSSCELIKSYGFQLGIQLMIGLPGDTHEKSLYSARETVKIGPSIARLYPTIIIDDTELLAMYRQGAYQPLSQQEAVFTTKEMYKILNTAGINIIRVGLKSTDIISENGAITGDTYHPAFRQLVEAEIAKEVLEDKLVKLLSSSEQYCSKSTMEKQHFTFESNSRCFSNMIGNKRSNKEYFSRKYPNLRIRFAENTLLADNHYNVLK
ncbi:elongator complex protein 3 [Aminipila terrae]|uniref:Radical SAM protein n=1 Tax=Aminipila terrae TaxID=2697030 RepID=A0A6P1MJX0_9FIRM|nr:radical SAM protein [Aminipila terrae]QHI71315.1 radical SAM protein [Aminipila terrae]